MFEIYYSIVVDTIAMLRTCPDCPTDMDLQSNDNMEKVKLTLDAFNYVGGWLKYFALLNVTKAKQQVYQVVFLFCFLLRLPNTSLTQSSLTENII